MDGDALSRALLDLAAPFVADPYRAALLFDVDGTLAPIVGDPAAAQPLPAAVSLLDALAARYGRVGAVSGRPVSFLADHLPPSMALSGLYGMESRIGGAFADHPDSGRWRPVVADAAARSRAEGPPGMLVESKGLSLTLHHRTDPSMGPAVEAWAAGLAAPSGLVMRRAKMSVELHPPVEADKGTAVRALIGEARAVLYVGDDVGDLPAFTALAELAAEGRHTVAVAVGGPELPPPVAAAVDLVLPDQPSVLTLLRALVPAS